VRLGWRKGDRENIRNVAVAKCDYSKQPLFLLEKSYKRTDSRSNSFQLYCLRVNELGDLKKPYTRVYGIFGESGDVC